MLIFEIGLRIVVLDVNTTFILKPDQVESFMALANQNPPQIIACRQRIPGFDRHCACTAMQMRKQNLSAMLTDDKRDLFSSIWRNRDGTAEHTSCATIERVHAD